MNYEQAYQRLMNVVMTEIDNVSIKAAEQVQDIHSSLSEVESSNEKIITSNEWNQMTYMERVDFKKQNPEAYNNALLGKFE